MPSYIELDKQSSFPASSNVGKLILGFNTDGSLQATDNNGQSVGVVGAPYKVYTALLTQNGGDNSLYYTDPSEGPGLTIGVTYSITDGIQGDDDFTNVGAPSGETYPIFVATGTTPNKWENGTRTYYNTGAPTVTVLENTIGNVWWTYDATGRYYLYSSSLFTENKTLITYTNNNYQDATGAMIVVSMYYVDTNTIKLDNAYDFNFYDGLVINMPIEIRVYN
jgi:hypothetical protein